MTRYFIDLTAGANDQLEAAGVLDICKEYTSSIPYLKSGYNEDGEKILEVDIDAMTHDNGNFRIKLSYLEAIKKAAETIREKNGK